MAGNMKSWNSSTARKSLDRLWSCLVKRRDGHRCQVPGCNYYGNFVESAHILTKAHGYSVRWNLLDGVTLCKWTHHRYWANDKPDEFREWALSRLTPEDRAFLERESEKLVQWGPTFYEQTLEKLRKEEKALEAKCAS